MKYVQYTNIVTGQVVDFDESIDGTVIEAGSPEVIDSLRYANGNDVGDWVCTEFMVS